MSEFTNNQKNRVKLLFDFTYALVKGESGADLYKKNRQLIDIITPSDVIIAFHKIVEQNISMQEIKKAVNKILNLLYKTLNNFSSIEPEKNSFLFFLKLNNLELDKKLKALRPLIKKLNKNPEEKNLKNELIQKFSNLLEYDKHYQIKENILFPELEKKWENYGCLKIMWSFHDDIRRNLKNIVKELQKNDFELKKFNKFSGDIFFNMYAIKFREEKILFPVILQTISEESLQEMLNQSIDLGFPYITKLVGASTLQHHKTSTLQHNKIDLKTGILSPEQIKLIFNHLPVDITYVDENDTVKYFSTPKKRIFTRTKAIVGRKVANCHPAESVHIVEKILNAFKTGKKDKASFYLTIKNEFILIQYFAIRDELGNYKGTIEVSQEITEIKNLKGKKTLLDWE